MVEEGVAAAVQVAVDAAGELEQRLQRAEGECSRHEEGLRACEAKLSASERGWSARHEADAGAQTRSDAAKVCARHRHARAAVHLSTRAAAAAATVAAAALEDLLLLDDVRAARACFGHRLARVGDGLFEPFWIACRHRRLEVVG